MFKTRRSYFFLRMLLTTRVVGDIEGIWEGLGVGLYVGKEMVAVATTIVGNVRPVQQDGLITLIGCERKAQQVDIIYRVDGKGRISQIENILT